MIGLLHRFFWEDSRTRWTTYALTAIAGILYATVRTLAFHAPERQVNIELIVFLFISNFSVILVYCLRGRKAVGESTRLLTYRLPLFLSAGGLVACVILLCAPQLSVSKVQAAIVDIRLERAASSIEPDKVTRLANNQLRDRFQTIAAIANTSMANNIPANPNLLERVKGNLEATIRSVGRRPEDVRQSGAAAFITLLAYARTNNVLISVKVPTILLPHGETGNYAISTVPLNNGAAWWQGSVQGTTIVGIPVGPLPVFPISHSKVFFNGVNFDGVGLRPFVGTDEESQVVIANSNIEGAIQKLDSIAWLNIKFKGSQIIYAGGPLYLGNVTFENCQFQFGSDPESQRVLAQIRAAENRPVTIVSGL